VQRHPFFNPPNVNSLAGNGRSDKAKLKLRVCCGSVRDALRTTELLMALEMSGGWQKRWDALKTAGLHPYPDAIEFRLDGTVDLTVGFLDAAP
jgi:hypothetical protein